MALPICKYTRGREIRILIADKSIKLSRITDKVNDSLIIDDAPLFALNLINLAKDIFHGVSIRPSME